MRMACQRIDLFSKHGLSPSQHVVDLPARANALARCIHPVIPRLAVWKSRMHSYYDCRNIVLPCRRRRFRGPIGFEDLAQPVDLRRVELGRVGVVQIDEINTVFDEVIVGIALVCIEVIISGIVVSLVVQRLLREPFLKLSAIFVSSAVCKQLVISDSEKDRRLSEWSDLILDEVIPCSIEILVHFVWPEPAAGSRYAVEVRILSLQHIAIDIEHASEIAHVPVELDRGPAAYILDRFCDFRHY